MSPASAVAGGLGFTLTTNGQNFVNGAVVYWNQTALTTTFVSANQLTAAVPAPLILTAGVVQITVLQSGILSAAAIFAVPSPPNAIDLATLAEVKGWIYTVQGTPADDFVLQLLITGASQFFLSETNVSTLNTVSTQTEHYNGNGQTSLPLRQYPITAVSQLVINGYTVPQTPNYVQPGWAIGTSRTSIVLVSGGSFSYYPGAGVPSVFPRGVLNVGVTYSAGYDGVPYDLNESCIQLVGQNYKRRGWIDQASIAMANAGGTQTFRGWDVPPQVRKTINNYKRRFGTGGA